MTFHVGQLVVCVEMSQSVNPDVPAIETLFKMREICRVKAVWPSIFGQLVEIEGRSPWRWSADRFRPLVDQFDDAELIARIKNCKPAPAQPHEAGVQVGGTREGLSSRPSATVAAERSHVADSSLQALDNASSQFTDTQSFIPHAEDL